jgi:hypothetical protein
MNGLISYANLLIVDNLDLGVSAHQREVINRYKN